MPGASNSIIIDVPSKAIYNVVIDFENYPSFLPDVKSVNVISHVKGKGVVVEFEISIIKKIRYRLAFESVASKKVTWKFVSGDLFKDNCGSWSFEEIKKGQTRATYDVEVQFGIPVPSLITNKLVGHNLPGMLKRFKEHAESLS